MFYTKHNVMKDKNTVLYKTLDYKNSIIQNNFNVCLPSSKIIFLNTEQIIFSNSTHSRPTKWV